MKSRSYLVIVLLLSFLLSCQQDKNRIIDENTVLDDREWQQDEMLEFEVTIADDSLTYDLALNIRNGIDYPYRNIFFLYSIEDENGHLVFADQHEFMLFDKLGKPLGSSESFLGISYGDLYYSSNSFKTFKFPKPGKYKIKVVQNMRNKPVLEGVMAVGIKVSY